MAFSLRNPIPHHVAEAMRGLYQSMDEKNRRRFAAVEAMRLGHGGIVYIAGLLDCSRSTIEVGMAELAGLPDDDPAAGRVRRPGGGRKKKSMPSRTSKPT